MTDTEILKSLGFDRSAKFWLSEKGLEMDVMKNSRETGGVYALVLDGEVVYVGKNNIELYRRLYGYKNPGPSQETNKRINELLRKQLQSEEKCDCWYISEERISKSEISLNIGENEVLAAPNNKLMEDLLINYFNPSWNKE